MMVMQFYNSAVAVTVVQMVDVTLKDGVEKQLVSLFPNELKGARDVTEHQRGEHSYY